MSDAWDTELGRYILARAAWDRRRNVQPLEGETWTPIGPDETPPVDPRCTADAAFQREIALAHEVCDEQVAADAAVVFVPPVPLPFGGPKES